MSSSRSFIELVVLLLSLFSLSDLFPHFSTIIHLKAPAVLAAFSLMKIIRFDQNSFRYLATVARFGPFCSGSQTTPVLAKGQEDDIIYVGFKEKVDALLALQATLHSTASFFLLFLEAGGSHTAHLGREWRDRGSLNCS